jgi:acyl-CoA synthetase (AMP-forming)/AMP-acid ligase II
MSMLGAKPSIVESPVPMVEVPAMTLPRYIREQARSRADKTAIIDAVSGRSLRYGELDRHIGRFAAGLAAHGFKPGDTLLIFAPNMPEWPVAALGALTAGGIVSGANPQYGAADLARQMGDARVRFVFTIAPLLATVREAGAAAGRVTVIVSGGGTADVAYETLLASTAPEPAIPEDPDALAALPYSSGTTGLQKGVMLTHRTVLSNLLQYNTATFEPGVAERMVTLALLPMFHIYGFTVVTLCGLARGARLVTLSRFEPEVFLQALQQHRITHLAVVPPVLHFLALHPLVGSYDLSSLELVGCGAAPLAAALEVKAAERVRCRVVQGYGMTESSGVIATTYPGCTRVGASGQLLPGTQARVVDPATQADVPRGERGEIWFRGPQAFRGYLNQPDATSATITADGWVRTGDIGHIDGEGYLYLTDRLKELIKVKGFQVAPAELEALLGTHPQVADAGVIGRADERTGERPVAYVVARGTLDPQAVRSWVAQQVPEYKQLADVVLCEAIPKTPSGKILRRVLRAQDAARAECVIGPTGEGRA